MTRTTETLIWFIWEVVPGQNVLPIGLKCENYLIRIALRIYKKHCQMRIRESFYTVRVCSKELQQ